MISQLALMPGDFAAAHGGLEVLIDATIKGSVILVAALLVARALRATSATNRYLVWSLAVCSLAAIPLLSGFMPKWQVPVLPTLDALGPDRDAAPADDLLPRLSPPDSAPAEARLPGHLQSEALAAHDYVQLLMEQALAEHLAAQAATGDEGKRPAEATEPGSPDDGAATRTQTMTAGRSPARLPWTMWIIATWLAGAAVFGALLLAGIGRIRSLTRSALPLDDDQWAAQLRNAALEVGADRPVVLRQCRQVRTPVTWGHFRPVILLPTSCRRWSTSRRRVVLLHELVHIRRRDWAMQILSQIIVAAYWFNPLVWVAVRRLAIERERACDDQVLGHGARPSDYAGHLLDIARTLASGGHLTMASLGMAHRTQLEGRLLAILDPKRPRRGFGRVATLTAVVGMGAGMLPLAAMSPWAEPATPATAIQDVVKRVGDELQIHADDNFNFSWTDDDVSIRLRINGEVVLTDDGIESISEDGQVRLTVTEDDETRRLVVRRGDNGEPTYTLTVDGEKRAMTAADRRWARRMIGQAVAKLREFDEDMADLKVEMDDLHEEMADLHLRLGRELGHIEIPAIEIPELRLHGLKGLGRLGELGHLKALHLDDEHFKALQDHLGELHLKMEPLMRLHLESPDLGHLKMNLEGLEKLKGLGALHDFHLGWNDDDGDEDDGDEEVDDNELKEKVRRHLEEQGQWRQAAPDAKALKEQIRRQIQEQMKALQDQLRRLDEDDDTGDVQVDLEKFRRDVAAMHKAMQERWREQAGQFKRTAPEALDWSGQLDSWKEHIPEMLEWQRRLWKQNADQMGIEPPDVGADFWRQQQPKWDVWQEHLRENLGRLHELPRIEMPDVEGLHRDLAPMLERLHRELPDLENLGEHIQKRLGPQMEKLQERLKALDEHIKALRGEMKDSIRDAIAEEVDADGLSRGGARQFENAIDDLAARLAERLGFNVEDGVCTLNDSAREIASRIERALEDMSADEFDYDGAILDRLKKATKAIAGRLTDLEIEMDREVLDRIKNFDSDFDFQFKFGGDDDDGGGDDDNDDGDGWDDAAVAAGIAA